MVRSFRILIAVVFSALILSGCDDTTQLKNKISDLQQQLTQYQQQAIDCESNLASDKDAKQAVLATLSRQTAFAQACAWGIQICPESIAEPSIAKIQIGKQTFQIQPDPRWFYFFAALKFIAMTIAAAAFVVATWRMYLWAIKPEKEDIAAARRDVESAKDRVQEAQREEQKIMASGADLKAKLESEIDNLQDEANSLGARRDALVQEVEELEARVREAKAAANLLDAAFKPKKK